LTSELLWGGFNFFPRNQSCFPVLAFSETRAMVNRTQDRLDQHFAKSGITAQQVLDTLGAGSAPQPPKQKQGGALPAIEHGVRAFTRAIEGPMPLVTAVGAHAAIRATAPLARQAAQQLIDTLGPLGAQLAAKELFEGGTPAMSAAIAEHVAAPIVESAAKQAIRSHIVRHGAEVARQIIEILGQ
jgi:hypothetical protein